MFDKGFRHRERDWVNEAGITKRSDSSVRGGRCSVSTSPSISQKDEVCSVLKMCSGGESVQMCNFVSLCGMTAAP